ncbi:MAG TPA: winged helix-turn-helix domain-containing protein [Bryobacteraceae bacterium]|jgi:DNA-binding winged helix-turn-helix (wHTH) protein/Tol biopolymer transport system component|nr:winged helix-turn-helix domain-containing protein [Bryobacteraceae bacterium]
MPEPDFYEIDDFEIDTKRRLLLSGGKPVPLKPRVFDTLLYLASNHGRVLEKDELMRAIWPDTTVEENNLNQNVSTLRRVLGEQRGENRYIVTVPGRGYKFVTAKPKFRDEAAEPQWGRISIRLADRSRTVGTSGNGGHSQIIRLASVRSWLILALGIAVMVAVLGFRPGHNRSPRAELMERRLTANSAENRVRSMAIAPNRKQLAFADKTGIYVKSIQRGDIHRVPLPPGFLGEVDEWFQDGSHLLVSRTEEPGRVSLWRVPASGGSPGRLADDASGASLSPDGTHIAFHRSQLTYDGLWGQEEWVMRSDGTDQVKVASGASDGSQMGAPTWSPDGKQIAYVQSTWAHNARRSSIQVNEWAKGKAVTSFSDTRLSPALRWLPDGRLIYAFGSTQHQQDSSLWSASLQASKVVSLSSRRLIEGHGWISRIVSSADGKVLVFLRGDWLSSVYLGAWSADGIHVVANRRLTLDENENIPTAWTPDSKAVLFSSDRNGRREIFKQPIDQNLPENLASSSSDDLSHPTLTPDGSEILYISTPKTQSPETRSSILAIPSAGGAPRKVLSDFRIWNVQCASFSSTTCMYSVTNGATAETFRFDVKSGKSAGPLQTDPDCNWSLSPDGSQRAIVAFGPRQKTIKLRSASTGETNELIVNGWSGLMGINWSQNGKSLLVCWHPHEWDSALLNIGLNGKADVLIRSNDLEIWHAVPSPNGHWLAIAGASGARNVWQLEGF